MRIKYIGILAALFYASLNPVLAADADMDPEIQHLLQYIQLSKCTFERNGSSHSANDAREHILMKYRHVKSHVDTAEEFIRHAATKSSMSGQLYEVVCNGERFATGVWLQQELERFRQR